MIAVKRNKRRPMKHSMWKYDELLMSYDYS